MKKIQIVSVIVVVSILGCTSGNDEPPVSEGGYQAAVPVIDTAPVHFEGIWQGTLTPSGQSIDLSAILIVNGWGEFRMVAGDSQFVGFPTRGGSTLAGDLTGMKPAGSAWSDGSRVSDFLVDGTINKDQFIDARYVGTVESGDMALTWSKDAGEATPADIDGLWQLENENGNPVASFLIEESGFVTSRINGNHENGCLYAGIADAWTSYRSFDIVPMRIKDCPVVDGININGEYYGSAALVDDPDGESDEQQLVFALSNEENQMHFFLHRVNSD